MKALSAAALTLAVAGAAAAAQQEPVYKAGDKGVSMPVVVFEKRPSYTAAAMRQKLQGMVEMEAVIDKDGKATGIKVVKSLDKVHGLDDRAVEALQAWRFKPAMKDGKAVPFRVTVEMSFTLRDNVIYDKTAAEVKPPVMVTEQKPSYTPEAMRARIEGAVEIEGIVGVDGQVTDVRVTKGLDAGLDANAVAAISQTTFKPATLYGRPVAYRLSMVFTFTLRD